MYKSSSNSRQASLFWDLETMLDSKHSLFKLANMVDWSTFEKAFAPLFCADNGRPPKPIRLMVGLLMLKHLRNVSDEQVVAQFRENAYYQYFCGLEAFCTAGPCASSELVHFRHRIGEEGVELILKESIRINIAMEDRKKEEMTGIRERRSWTQERPSSGTELLQGSRSNYAFNALFTSLNVAKVTMKEMGMEYSMSSFKSLMTNIYLVKRIFKASGYTPNRTLISKIFKDLSCLQRIAA